MFTRNKASPLTPILNSWETLSSFTKKNKKKDITVTFKFGNRVISSAIILNVVKATRNEIKLQIFLPGLGLEIITLTPWSFNKKKQRSHR